MRRERERETGWSDGWMDRRWMDGLSATEEEERRESERERETGSLQSIDINN
jgi:hypothetical protein